MPRHPGQRAGRQLIPRRPFALRADNSFDYPLSSSFDESDNYVVFDNVFVPWEHVFIYRNLQLTRDQWYKTPSHSYGNHQAQVRYVTKLRFMIGLAQHVVEMIGSAGSPTGALTCRWSLFLSRSRSSLLRPPVKIGGNLIEDTSNIWPLDDSINLRS